MFNIMAEEFGTSGEKSELIPEISACLLLCLNAVAMRR